MENLGEFRVEEFPASRIGTTDIGAVGLKKHHIKALIELDVTEARKLLRERKKLGEKISFNSWLIKCISLAVEEFREINGVRKGKRRVVVFDDIDISIVIEREVDGQKVPLPYVIRRTNAKTIAEIDLEVKNGQGQVIQGKENYVLGEANKSSHLMELYYALPGAIRRWVWKRMLKSPSLTKQNMGTVMITSLGMIGRINGWVIPVSVHPLCFAIGSVIRKPGVMNDKIEIREYLHLTALIDHDIIDGAPAVRALSRLTRLIENGAGLQGNIGMENKA